MPLRTAQAVARQLQARNIGSEAWASRRGSSGGSGGFPVGGSGAGGAGAFYQLKAALTAKIV